MTFVPALRHEMLKEVELEDYLLLGLPFLYRCRLFVAAHKVDVRAKSVDLYKVRAVNCFDIRRERNAIQGGIVRAEPLVLVGII